MRRTAACALALALFAPAALAAEYREETLKLKLEDGGELAAHLRKPAGATGRLPAVLLFGGFEGAAGVMDLVRPGKPLILASFDYPYTPPRRFEFPSSLATAPELRRALHETVDGMGKLAEALAQRADVNPRRITLAAASFAAPLAVIAAARYDVPGLVLVQGFGRVTDVLGHQLYRKLAPDYGDWVKVPVWWAAALAVWYLDLAAPEDAAARLRKDQKALMISAEHDERIPRAASDALWQGLARSQAVHQRLVLQGKHLHGKDSAEQIGDILQRSLEWAQKQGLM